MSETQWSPVVIPDSIVLPGNASNSISGPLLLYTLSPSEVSRIEIVTLVAEFTHSLSFAPTFRLELTDPSGHPLYRYSTPEALGS